MNPELIAQYDCKCGEGPMWHPKEKCLYWTDIETSRFFRYDPATGKHGMIYSGRQVGGYTLQADGSLLLFMDRGTVGVLRNGKMTPIIEEIPDEVGSRFNDVIADPEGRVFAGTMATKDRPGRLYRIDTDGSYHLLLEGILCPNGMGYTANTRTMYFTDALARKIYAFDYNRTTGAMTNQRIVVQLEDSDGYPDGMTVDEEGYLWSAVWDGWSVRRYTPGGKEVRRITLPVKKVSCPVFGGDDLSDLYLTTAGGDNKKENGEHAGALYRVKAGVKGVPEFVSRVRLQ